MAASIEFPNSREVLWDRSTISQSHFIKAADVIPPLYISAVSVLSMLDELSSTDLTIERRAYAYHVNSLDKKESSSQIPLKSIIGSHKSVLKIDGNFFDEHKQKATNTESSVTIPISRCGLSDFDLSFDKDSTQ
jgi:hypothetical protein